MEYQEMKDLFYIQWFCYANKLQLKQFTPRNHYCHNCGVLNDTLRLRQSKFLSLNVNNTNRQPDSYITYSGITPWWELNY